jgi:hypothetical protein
LSELKIGGPSASEEDPNQNVMFPIVLSSVGCGERPKRPLSEEAISSAITVSFMGSLGLALRASSVMFFLRRISPKKKH